ncbi:MAG: cytochrome ubiquinol oxidase subunit I, partial [Deltaproteobacteria bacterium]
MPISEYMMRKTIGAICPALILAFGLLIYALFAPSIALSADKGLSPGAGAVQESLAPIGENHSITAPLSTSVRPGSVLSAAEGQSAPRLKAGDYPSVRGVNGRVAVWLAAQMHLWFAAFVLAVPIFVLVIEFIGVYTGNDRYDEMAYEFIRVSMTAYSVTAITGGVLLVSLIVFYPDLMKYLSGIFAPTMLLYALLFFVETGALYLYYYGWHSMRRGSLKRVHLGVGLVLNGAGTSLMI